MYGYRHVYHAGNVADVFKHLMLTALLQAQTAKATPLAYLESHAGAGGQDLTDARAAHNAEYRSGALALYGAARDDAPPAAASLLAHLHACNASATLRHYPGSPAIAARLLRPGDRLLLWEMLDEECAALQARFGRDRRVALHQADGYAGLSAWLPPRERRGLVFIDPAYERSDEAARVAAAVAACMSRFGHGVLALWLPLRGKLDSARLLRRCLGAGGASALWLQLRVEPVMPGALSSALLILNPPYVFQSSYAAELDWLVGTLPGALRAHWSALWPERAARE